MLQQGHIPARQLTKWSFPIQHFNRLQFDNICLFCVSPNTRVLKLQKLFLSNITFNFDFCYILNENIFFLISYVAGTTMTSTT